MSAPSLDTIADMIVDRIKAGTYTSAYKITEVARPNQKFSNLTVSPFLCVVQLVDIGETPDSEYAEEAGPNPFYRLTGTFQATVIVMEPEDSQEPHDRLALYLISDMAKAITADDADWAQWGGNAINSRWRPLMESADNGAIYAVSLEIDVDVALKSTDPYVSRA